MNNRYIVTTALIVALGGFLMGFDASVISGVVKFIEPAFDLTKIELGWAVSCLTLTATFAMMVAGPISDKIGRRAVLKYAAILYAVSAILSAVAPSFITLVIARMIGGLGVGASLIIAPMYIAEIAPPASRGKLVSFNQLNIVIGISVAFFTNYLILQLGKSDASWIQSLKINEWNWRWMLGIETIPAILYYIGLHFVPRSPRWLLMKNKWDEAIIIMEKAVGKEKASTELSLINNSITKDDNIESVSIKELFKKSMSLVLTIGVVIGILQQITGINSVFFYAPMIFEQSGIGTDASFSQAIYVGIINLIFTLLAIAFIDKIGRKPLLIGGLTGIALSMFLLAHSFNGATYSLSNESIAKLPKGLNTELFDPIIGQTYNNDLDFKEALTKVLGKEAETFESELISAAINMNSILVLIGILGFVASFAISIGPVMWVLFSELFPNKIRGLAISFVGLVNSGISFLVQLLFPWELANIGTAATFLIYGIFGAIGIAFVIWKVPETKGKSLEDLEKFLIK